MKMAFDVPVVLLFTHGGECYPSQKGTLHALLSKSN